MDFATDLQAAFSKLIDKMEGWVESAFLMLPNFVVAVLVLLAFVGISKLLRKLVDKVMSKFSYYGPLNRLLQNTVSIGLIAIGTFVALSILHLDQAVTSLLAGAGIVGLALGFAFQDITANFISGVFISIQKPIKIGDWIESNDVYGKVDKVTLRTTRIHTPQGQIVYIPNKEIFQNILKNYSVNKRRIDLEVGVSYGEDLKKVKKVAVESIEKIDYLLDGKKVKFYYKEFGGSSINFVIQYWVPFNDQPDYLRGLSDGIMNVKSAFDEAGITIPFPIRTLDFGIKGGETFKEMLKDSTLYQKNRSKNNSDNSGERNDDQFEKQYQNGYGDN
ncbi:MAG: mechanosensitive ion channel family protein [Bacteroidota bacterium]